MDTLTAAIAVFIAVSLVFIGYLLGRKLADLHWKLRLVPQIREDAIKGSRAVLGGQFSEQLAPYLPDFPYSPTEVRFMGKPIDFIVFKGMDQKDISEVVFVEVKSGKSSLNQHERKLRDTIEGKKVSWQEYRIPEAITKKKD
jgi:predicted Holliday junction resolvase-like endonuclease